MMKIPLSNGGYTVVDNEDYDYINNWKWVRSSRGYAQRGSKVKIDDEFRGVTYLIHRVLMDAKKGQQIDHVNGNPLDNRRSNLRFSTQKQNLRNQKVAKNNKTGHKGVSVCGNKYRAMIGMDGKLKHLGLFNTVEEASMAYNVAAFQYDPEFSRLN